MAQTRTHQPGRSGGLATPRSRSPRAPTLRACLGCGRPTPGRHCPTCEPQVKTYASAEYQTNRAELLATATHCWICGLPPTEDDKLTADHRVGRSAGGGNHPSNLLPAHESCNKSRGARMEKRIS